MVSLRDSYRVFKYTDEIEIIQYQVDIPARTTVAVTYTPPAGKFFVWMWGSSGSMSYKIGHITAIVDGTMVWDTLYTTGALEHYLDLSWYRPVKNKLELILTVTDVTTHTADFLLIGVLVPQGQYDEFIKYIRGDEELEVLKDIRNWLMKTLKK